MNRKLTIGEVASQLNVSTSTVRRWVYSGKLVGHKAGAQWRFDPNVVRDAFEQGMLSGDSQSMRPAIGAIPYPTELPDWTKPLLNKWQIFLVDLLRELQPDHVIVNDRRGAKIWALMKVDDYVWGSNLWHSTAVELMEPREVTRLFHHRKILLFDEMMQHGREMNKLRKRLTAKDIDALVTSVVCVRRKSHAESGDLLEYEALTCEDIDDKMFAERAVAISRLVHSFEPPLDVDHLIVKGKLAPKLKAEEFLERLAKWGMPFVVWHSDKEHKYMAITLDRPQFFDTASYCPNGFSFSWDGPCKIRFYVNPENGECYCSFIVYPDIEAPLTEWLNSGAKMLRTGQPKGNTEVSGPLFSSESEEAFRRIYWSICLNLTVNLINDFLLSGAAEHIGINLDSSLSIVDKGQLQATFGPSLGDTMVKRMNEVLIHAKRGKELFPKIAESPPSLFIRSDAGLHKGSRDVFECRVDLVKAIPRRFGGDGSNGEQSLPISYGQLVERLPKHNTYTIGRVFDYELDRGTVKPTIHCLYNDRVKKISVRRAYWRGEYGVWYEWYRDDALTHVDKAIRRTLGFGPKMIDIYLKRIDEPSLGATHFNKLFANLQHDLVENPDEIFFIGWRPYKYGPIPITEATSGEYREFHRFLVDRRCLIQISEKRGSQTVRKYKPAENDEVPWQKLYDENVRSVTRSLLQGLLRLYAVIQKDCKTVRRSDPRSSGLSLFQDPLVVLSAARNKKIAYRCAYFEVSDWIEQGERSLFPLLKSVVLGNPPKTPFLSSYLEDFAAPARLLFDKIEMYRHLPYLREQIKSIVEEGDFEAGLVLLETVDSDVTFEVNSEYPMQNLEWACSIMRAFSSMIRQVMTSCNLDIEKRKPNKMVDEKGAPKDASFYLQELLTCCPELQSLEDRLLACIDDTKGGVFTEEMASTLYNTFCLILDQFKHKNRIPDPRPSYERDKEKLQKWVGLANTLRNVQIPHPYAVAVLDIRNVQNLPRLTRFFGGSYEEGLKGLERFVEQAANNVIKRFSSQGLALGGFTADNIILAGPTADVVLEGTIDLIKETTQQYASVDRNQIAPFGLLRAGIAWLEDELGEEFQGVQPGLTAHALGDKTGRGLGAIVVTEAIYKRLSRLHLSEFKIISENSGQGQVFIRLWNHDRDSS